VARPPDDLERLRHMLAERHLHAPRRRIDLPIYGQHALHRGISPPAHSV